MDDDLRPEDKDDIRSRLVSGVVLPDEPGVEELARDWTLSEPDLLHEVLLCRGVDNCLRFALQLCVLRKFGRFLEEYDESLVRIVNHLAAQLHLPPVLLLAPPRSSTESEYRDRLRRYLGLTDLDQAGRDRLAAWVSERMADGEAPGAIAGHAEQMVRDWRYVLPRSAEGDVFERIASQIRPEGRRRIDELLTVADGDPRSMLFRLKEYPPRGTPQTIREYMTCYRRRCALRGTSAKSGVSAGI